MALAAATSSSVNVATGGGGLGLAPSTATGGGRLGNKPFGLGGVLCALAGGEGLRAGGGTGGP